MSSRHLVLTAALVLFLLAAAPAGATVLVTPDGQIAPQPYQSWVDAAYVPTPPGEGVLSLEGCPGDPALPACSPSNQGTIQLSREWATRRRGSAAGGRRAPRRRRRGSRRRRRRCRSPGRRRAR